MDYQGKTPGEQMEIFFNGYNQKRLNGLYKILFSAVEFPFSIEKMIDIGMVYSVLEKRTEHTEDHNVLFIRNIFDKDNYKLLYLRKYIIFDKGTEYFKSIYKIFQMYIKGPDVNDLLKEKIIICECFIYVWDDSCFKEDNSGTIIKQNNLLFSYDLDVPDLFEKKSFKKNHPGNYHNNKKNHLYKTKGKF